MIRIINHSELSPGWNWLESLTRDANIEWRQSTTQSFTTVNKLPKGVVLSRILAARAAIQLSQTEQPILVSHGPRPAFYASLLSSRRSHPKHHLAFSFNFTTLPNAARVSPMIRAYKKIERFVVASSLERTLYSRVFDIEPERIHVQLWAVKPHFKERLPRPVPEGRYLCAVGAQGRDYRVLLDAMRRIPSCHLHLVTYPGNVAGMSVPNNVTVHFDVPFDFAAALVAHADAMLLPLTGTQVPCGHVTAVMAMHLGVPLLATNSEGLSDYLREGDTALLFDPESPDAIYEKITAFLDDPSAARACAERAKVFATKYCSEASTVRYFQRYVQSCYGYTPTMATPDDLPS